MVQILDGNSEISAYVWLFNLFKDFFTSKAVKNLIFFSEKTFYPLHVRNMHLLPSDINAMV